MHYRSFPGVVRCLGAFEDSSGYYQALELCAEGDLYRALHAKGAPFSEEEVCSQVFPPCYIHLHLSSVRACA